MDLQTRKEQIIMHLAERHTPFQLFSKDEFLDMVEKNIQPFRRLMSFIDVQRWRSKQSSRSLMRKCRWKVNTTPLKALKRELKVSIVWYAR